MEGFNLMRKLENTPEDRQFLNTMISTGLFPKVKVELGVFITELSSSLTNIEYYGDITYVDMADGCCSWEHNGIKMPCVNINVITLI